jgi:hypothetical protein
MEIKLDDLQYGRESCLNDDNLFIWLYQSLTSNYIILLYCITKNKNKYHFCVKKKRISIIFISWLELTSIHLIKDNISFSTTYIKLFHFSIHLTKDNISFSTIYIKLFHFIMSFVFTCIIFYFYIFRMLIWFINFFSLLSV